MYICLDIKMALKIFYINIAVILQVALASCSPSLHTVCRTNAERSIPDL